MSDVNKNKLKSAIESILFVWGEPISIKDISIATNYEKEDIANAIEELIEEYEDNSRGIRIRRVDKSFQIVSKEENYSYIETLVRPIKNKKLSQASLEVLALIAYKQPVTRAEIDGVRGIKSERVIDTLIEKDFVCEKGRSEGLGRPILYGTTEKFLRYLNIKNLKELPDLKEFTDDYEMLSQWEKNQISLEDLNEEQGEKNE